MTGRFVKGAWVEDVAPAKENRNENKFGKISIPVEIHLPEFLTASRVGLCLCRTCRNNLYQIGEIDCNCKHIEIDENGRCIQFSKTEVR